MSDMTLPELVEEALRLSRRLEALTTEQYRAARRFAEASVAFEEAAATAWVTVRLELGNTDENGVKRLAKDYDAEVRLRVKEEAAAAADAHAMDKVLESSARNFRQQLSSCQSVAAAMREEMRLAGGVS